jgi:hypothetical protein
MTNLQSVAGSFVWAAVAGLLMLATLEPIKVDQKPAALQLSQNEVPAAGQASL